MSDLGPVFKGLKWKLGSLGHWRRRDDDSMRLSLRWSCPCDKSLHEGAGEADPEGG